MRTLPGRTQLLLSLFVAAVLGGVAGGMVAARDGAGQGLDTGPPGVLAKGSFKSVSWGTDGTAAIVREHSGKLKLRLSSAFSTQRAPELFVYLAQYDNGRRTAWKQVARLRSAFGSQEYALRGVTPRTLRASVEIFCEKCNKAWGVAELEPTSAPTS